MNLIDPPTRPAVKICGFTVASEAEAAIEAGADAIGLNFWPKSKRYISPDTEWLRVFETPATRVGLFVNATLDEVRSVFETGLIDLAQLHGDEEPEFIEKLGYPAFKAMGVKERATLETIPTFPGELILLDAWAPIERGGTGETMDWILGRDAVECYPERKIILAGGLTPDTISKAVTQVAPHGVDVASGVESGTPGRKDLAKVRDFIAAAKGV